MPLPVPRPATSEDDEFRKARAAAVNTEEALREYLQLQQLLFFDAGTDSKIEMIKAAREARNGHGGMLMIRLPQQAARGRSPRSPRPEAIFLDEHQKNVFTSFLS